MKVYLTFNKEQERFLRNAQRKINANRPKDQKVTEIDVIKQLMEAGYVPFSNQIDALPIKLINQLKLIK